MSLWGLSGPAILTMMTRRVSVSEQGQLQGAQTSIMGLTGLFAPGMFSLTFAAGISDGADFPGAAFMLAAVLLCLAVPLAAWVTRAGESHLEFFGKRIGSCLAWG